MQEPLPRNLTEAYEHLRALGGLTVSKLPIGTVITVKTTQHSYEFKRIESQEGFIEVSGDDPRLTTGIPMLGIFERSVYGVDPRVLIEDWIGKSMKMQVRFKNATMTTAVAISVTVHGPDWFYDVF